LAEARGCSLADVLGIGVGSGAQDET